MQRFPGYTYTSLLAEDPELLRLVEIECRGTPDTGEEVSPYGQ